jgi:cathepsin B
LSDRFCIATHGKIDVVMSPQTLVSCDSSNMGCDGGYLDAAWEFIQSNGIASDVCEPYTSGNGVTGTCPKTCADGSAVKYFKASGYKHITGVSQIQTEIMTNGPVQVAFQVYQDFMSYSSGVYHHVSGGLLGGHAVETVGWGVENNTPYWLVKNSWSDSWGLQGYFKILRGSDECGIESSVYAGTPAVSQSFMVNY